MMFFSISRFTFLVVTILLPLAAVLTTTTPIFVQGEEEIQDDADDDPYYEEEEPDRYEPPYTPDEREEEYYRRGHEWPITEFVPNTEGWTRLMKQRFEQIQAIQDMQQKFDGWIQTMSAALTVPNHTEFGWGLTQAPKSLTKDLRQAIYDGLPNARSEGIVDVIEAPLPPLFIDRWDLTQRALKELQPILEAWVGFKLVPEIAYGFRLYRNESRLWMHVDRTQTHVVSCIMHIASSEDSQPWPIVIEDYSGRTNEVILHPGDILLYESAKNFHGRPKPFIGSWYTSLFVHFYPDDGKWKYHNHDLDSHYAVPPIWSETTPPSLKKSDDDYPPQLKLVGTSMQEPNCPNRWCNLQNAIHWEGPGVYGEVLTTGRKQYPLFETNLDGNDIDIDDDDEKEDL